MIYYAFITLGLGEVAPVNLIEYVFSLLSLLVSVVYFNILFGKIASIEESMTIDKEKEQRAIDAANTVMDAIELSWADRLSIRVYKMKTEAAKNFQEQQVEFIEDLP